MGEHLPERPRAPSAREPRHQRSRAATRPLQPRLRYRTGPVDPERVRSDNPAVLSPAGRLHVALADWAKFQRVFLTGGDGFLRPETVERPLTPASGRGHRHALGWAPAAGLGHASFGQQGSNTYWVATALIDRVRQPTAMVVCNEGRARLLKQTPGLALRFLAT